MPLAHSPFICLSSLLFTASRLIYNHIVSLSTLLLFFTILGIFRSCWSLWSRLPSLWSKVPSFLIADPGRLRHPAGPFIFVNRRLDDVHFVRNLDMYIGSLFQNLIDRSLHIQIFPIFNEWIVFSHYCRQDALCQWSRIPPSSWACKRGAQKLHRD